MLKAAKELKLWITGQSKTIDRMKFNRWLKEYKIKVKKFTINDDFSIDIDGDFNISGLKLSTLPFKLNFVNGDMLCSNNEFKNLLNFPQKIQGKLDCSNNKLETLKGCPEILLGLMINNNNIKKLEFLPNKIMGDFDCSHNKINSLKGSPSIIDGDFNCSNNKLKTLENCPVVIGKNLLCIENKITTLESSPNVIGGNFFCNNNKIETIKGFNNLYFNGELVLDNTKELMQQEYIKEIFPTWESIVKLNRKTLQELLLKMDKKEVNLLKEPLIEPKIEKPKKMRIL